MTTNEIKYRRAELAKKASRLLNPDQDEYKKLSQEEQGELQEILLEMIGLDIKITSSDPNINTQAPRIRKKKKTKEKNKQLILTF